MMYGMKATYTTKEAKGEKEMTNKKKKKSSGNNVVLGKYAK